MKPDTEQIIQSLKAGAWEGEKIMELAADRLEELQKECDEARAEVKERTEALLDAAKQIDELKKQRDHWLEKAKQENENFLEARADLERLKQENAALCELAESRLLKIDQQQAEILTLKNKLPRSDETIISKSKLERQQNTREEPSRLEIAAMLMAAHVYHLGMMYPEGLTLRQACFIEADALIAAAKEAK